MLVVILPLFTQSVKLRVTVLSDDTGTLAIRPPLWFAEVICPLFTQLLKTIDALVVTLPTIPAPYAVEPEGIVTFALFVIESNVMVVVLDAFISYTTGVLEIEVDESPGVSTVKFLMVAPAPILLNIVPDTVIVCPPPSNVPVNVSLKMASAETVVSALSLYEPDRPPYQLLPTFLQKSSQLDTETTRVEAENAATGRIDTSNAKASSKVDARFKMFVFINFSFLKT